MGSRKDLIKRSLGITEYPWSSDDELEAAPPVEEASVRRPIVEARPSGTDAPGTSGASTQAQTQQQQQAEPQQQQQAASRHQARRDRDLFWSIINSPHGITNQNLRSRAGEEGAGPSRVSQVPAPEQWTSDRLRRDMQRITEFKQLARNAAMRRRFTVPRFSVDPAVVVPSEANSNVIVNRHSPFRRVPPPTPSSRPSRNDNYVVPRVRFSDLMMATGEGERSPAARLRSSMRATRAPAGCLVRDRDLLRASSSADAGGARGRVAPWLSGMRQLEAPRSPPLPMLTSEDDVRNNNNEPITFPPLGNARPPPPPVTLEERNGEQDVSLEGDLGVVVVDTSHSNVTLEEEIVAIDLDNSDTPQVVGEEERDTSAPAGGQDENDGRFSDEYHRPDASGDANLTSTNNANENAAASQPADHETTTSRGRRDSYDNTEPNSVKEFNQNLLRLLECPVCLEWMEPPMSQCRRGHLVCGVCRARLASCPVCRTTFSSVRNRAMEGVAEMLRYPCRHGCGREVRLRRRAPHEASCAARKYQCPAPLCAAAAPLPRQALAQHFQSQHLTMMKIGRQHKFSIKVNSEQHDNWLILAMEQYFHLRIDVDIRTWGMVVYVSYIGPKCDAKNYTYEVTVDGQHNQRKLVYARTTHSDLESSSLNVCRQDCFHLTLDQALNFIRIKNRRCDTVKYLDFNLEIAKVERPVEPLEESDS